MTLTIFMTYNPLYKVLISVIVLLVVTRLQTNLKPYKDDQNNYIELLGTYAGTITLFAGVIFASDETNIGWIDTLLFAVIVIVNLKFMLEWFYLFIICMSDRYKFLLKFQLVLDVLLCKKCVKIVIPHQNVEIKQTQIQTKIKSKRKRLMKRSSRKVKKAEEAKIKIDPLFAHKNEINSQKNQGPDKESLINEFNKLVSTDRGKESKNCLKHSVKVARQEINNIDSECSEEFELGESEAKRFEESPIPKGKRKSFGSNSSESYKPSLNYKISKNQRMINWNESSLGKPNEVIQNNNIVEEYKSKKHRKSKLE